MLHKKIELKGTNSQKQNDASADSLDCIPEETENDNSDLCDDSMELLCPLGPFSPPAKDLAYYLPKYEDTEFGFMREYVEENNISPDDMYNTKETYMEFFTRLFSESAMLLDISRSISVSKIIKALRKNE